MCSVTTEEVNTKNGIFQLNILFLQNSQKYYWG